MQSSRLTADHKRLADLAGTWKGTEKMYPSGWDPKGGEASATKTARVALGGFAVVVDYEQERDGTCSFQGHGVYTFDHKAKEVVLHWFDSMDTGAEVFRGKWDGARLSLCSKNAMGFARMNYEFSASGTHSARMEMSPDGQKWSVLFDGSYEREA